MRNKEIPVLMYHQFLKNGESGNNRIKTYVNQKKFKLHLRILKFLGYESITFKDLERIGLENRFNKKYIIITVDDGYENNYDVMFPILKIFNMKVVIFLVSNEEYNKWDVKSCGVKKLSLLKKEQIEEMIESGLVEFGGHTLSHCDFHKVNLDIAEKEIFEDKKLTEEKYGITLTSFAYPYGHLSEEVKLLVKKAGYKFAVSTDTGTGKFEDDLFEIRRAAIDKTSILSFLKRISFKYSIYKAKKSKSRNF